MRLEKYLLRWAGRGGGKWKPCPSYSRLCKYLRVCRDTLSRAFRKLEESSGCPLAFVSTFDGPDGTRQKMFCLKTWLRHDCLPLLYRKDGSSRGVRPSFRRGEAAAPFADPRSRPPAAPAPGSGDVGGKSGFCHPPFIKKRLPSADMLLTLPEKPVPAVAGMSQRALWWAAGSAAKEAAGDSSLFWPSSKVEMPFRALKSLFHDAFRRGVEWGRVKHLLRRSVEDAHAAAVNSECGGKAVRNPGGFAAAVFRARLSGRVFAPAPRGRPAPAEPPKPAPPPPPPRCIPAAPSRTAEEVARVQANALSLAAALREALGGAGGGRRPAAGGLSVSKTFQEQMQ